MMQWDTVIGLEVHAQLTTKSKLFSGTANCYGAPPNSLSSYIDAGLPGVLPVLNSQAVKLAIQFGLAIDAEINDLSFFERKNYFYPDLPKGYQISQFQRPIVSNGKLTIKVGSEIKQVKIERAHLEEDAGKSLHEAHPEFTGIDLNRAGAPLLEIVTAPCLYSAAEAIAYLKALHQLVRFIGICDGNMQEGSFRCDVNLSLKPHGSDKLGTRAELKNLNSFRFIEKAIIYEQARQQDLLEAGLKVKQETRLFCPVTETTQVLRSKENEHDYRYFSDPDLLPIKIEQHDLTEIKANMPPLPQQIEQELSTIEHFNEEDINFLLSSPAVYCFYNAVKRQTRSQEKLIVNWLKGPYLAALNTHGQTFEQPPLAADLLAALLDKISDQTIANNIARKIFDKLWAKEGTVAELIGQFKPVNDAPALEQLVNQLIIDYPEQAKQYQEGKEKLLAFFVGQVMKQTKGQANPEQVSCLLKAKLNTTN